MSEIADTYENPVRIAVIGGTGLKELPGFKQVASLDVTTPWGSPSSPIVILHHPSPSTGQEVPVAFLSRHGLHHQMAPHEIPNRANVAALRSLGVRTVVAFSAVGSLREDIKPKDFVVPTQIIDRTKGVRPWTFFEGGLVGHVGFADPFDDKIAAVVRGCGHALEGDGVVLHDDGTLICMEGPQFSTRAESNLYRSWGGSVINMSALPEAKLAREAEMAYQMICMSTDYDCWRVEADHETAAKTQTQTQTPHVASVTVELVMANMRANAGNARRLVAAVLDELSRDEHLDLVLARHLQGQSKMASGITAPPGRDVEAVRKLRWLFPDYF